MTASSETNDLKSLLDKLENKTESKIDRLDSKIEELKIGQATIKNDLVWIKWLFGVFSTILTLLLSILITVLFKIVN